MNTSKIITVTVILFVILGICTCIVASTKPNMHKTMQLEQIIYKRGK